MAKSRGRKFAELVAPANGVFAAASIPTIAISKLATSTFSVNSESASLGGNVVIDSNDVTEHTNALYFTNARADARITAASLLPLAGGTMTGNLTLGDNVNAYFGASTDLRIYHDGTNSHIINSTGELRITGSNIAIKSDSNKLYLGAGDDLKIYHDGSNSYIEDAGTGSLILKGGTISVNGAYTLPTSDGSANQVLQTDGSGTLSFANAGSGSSVFSTSGSDIYYDSGNVGIGAASASSRLDIRTGNTASSSNFATKAIIVRMPLVSGYNNVITSGLGFYDNTIHSTDIGYAYNRNSTGGYDLVFSTNPTTSGSPVERMTINADGLVGIGATAPAAPLHINSSTDQHIILSGATNPYIRWQEASTNKAYMQWNGAGHIEIRNQEDGSSFRIKDALDFSLDGSTYHTVWHAGNDGAGSGLDADTLDGVQGANFLRSDTSDTMSGNLAVSAGTANGSNDASLYVTADNNNDWGLIVDKYRSSATEYGAEIRVASNASYAFSILGNGNRNFRIDGNGNVYAAGTNAVWHAGNDGSGSGLDADTLDGLEGSFYFKSYTNNNGGWSQSNRNFSVRSGGDAVGLHMEESDGTFGFQIYGNSSNYGFLDGEWANWDLKKTINGELYVDAGGGLKKVWHEGNDGSGSGLDADLLDGLQAKSTNGNIGASQVLRSHSNGYTYLGNWIEMGTAGLFSTTTNGAHIYPNASGSYGAWNILGARNGYTGFYLDAGGDVTTGMYDSAGNGGDYYSGSWHFYWNRGNACLALGGSTTSASYKTYVNGALYATANIVAYSDRRIKENIVPIDNALEKVNKLAGVYYNKIDDEKKTREIGFIAQDVNEVTPELVTYAEDVDQYGVKYGNTTALLVEAVKELTQQVKDLKQELEELKNG